MSGLSSQKIGADVAKAIELAISIKEDPWNPAYSNEVKGKSFSEILSDQVFGVKFKTNLTTHFKDDQVVQKAYVDFLEGAETFYQDYTKEREQQKSAPKSTPKDNWWKTSLSSIYQSVATLCTKVGKVCIGKESIASLWLTSGQDVTIPFEKLIVDLKQGVQGEYLKTITEYKEANEQFVTLSYQAMMDPRNKELEQKRLSSLERRKTLGLKQLALEEIKLVKKPTNTPIVPSSRGGEAKR